MAHRADDIRQDIADAQQDIADTRAAMTEKLDPEDVHEIVRRAFELITTEIHRFEGTINQYCQ